MAPPNSAILQVTTFVYVTTRDCVICGPTEREIERLIDVWPDDIAFIRVNADQQPRLVSFLGTKAVPALFIFAPGMRVKTLLGFRSMERLYMLLLSAISTADGG